MGAGQPKNPCSFETFREPANVSDSPMIIEWTIVVLQLIFLEGILSIDNAAVLGAMAASLPPDQAIPWPRRLRALGHPLDRLLGGQRSAALKVGLLGAYLGRAAMLLVAHFIVQNPWLRMLGGSYLIYLGADHLSGLADDASHDETAHQPETQRSGFWSVVLAIELADLAFSLDNVVAAVALSSNMAVVLLGVALGIVTMRFAATLFANLVTREPVLEPAAYILVLTIGLRLIIEEFLPIHIPVSIQFGMSVLIILGALLYAHWRPLRTLRPLVVWSLRLLHTILSFFRSALGWPVARLGGLIQLLWRAD